jgi:hypothetical protein
MTLPKRGQTAAVRLSPLDGQATGCLAPFLRPP